MELRDLLGRIGEVIEDEPKRCAVVVIAASSDLKVVEVTTNLEDAEQLRLVEHTAGELRAEMLRKSVQ